ncbi:LytTR family DNA-binding domain-containing protein [Saprospira sp. CCB-QB6]|uniref:LytR/AlgR family response regulator transcription factor n=1 Tax=Saprospira sp. CCB-QB6 TaxID=3023936 RepID=UPI002349AA43|nr:LytTR family DNA-binding domain-containing protein [Saprospira sp. CCB-QB6]WCL81823.1 LytTR family DNA-binding domain-containing protein [Saprospira sp. CCB-QB6]
MNVLIVDDEPLARDVLQTYIEKLPSLTLIGSCQNAIEAFEQLNSQKVDLMLLDIHMPQISGIDFLKTLAQPPLVIFTTAYSNYALESYELNVVDYLLKPIAFDRFVKAINKAIELQKNRGQERQAPVEEPQTKGSDYIFVKADKKLIKVRFDEIFYIEGLKDYVILHTPQGRIVTLQTMKLLEAKLPAHLFKRVHRSYIANLSKIAMLEGNMLELNGKSIPVGKNYRDELLAIINEKRL